MAKKINFQEALKKETILKGFVKMAKEGLEDKKVIELVLICGTDKVIVPAGEIVPLPYEARVSAYVGTEIEFIVTDIDANGVIYGSNKKAIDKKVKPVYESLYAGEIVEGIVTHIVKYGAYIDLGGVPVLLKNVNFSDDGTAVSEKYKVGMPIQVKYLKTSSNNTIIVQPKEIHKGFKSIKFEDFEVGGVVCGKVVKLTSDRVYVNIAPSLDALCSIPKYMCAFEEGDIVRISITRVIPEQQRIRGKILNVISN